MFYLGILATTTTTTAADDDDAEDAARTGKKSHVHSAWWADASPGHGQPI